jgi:hypothetical protein
MLIEAITAPQTTNITPMVYRGSQYTIAYIRNTATDGTKIGQ